MSLDNIQLDIVVTLQGSQAIKTATTALQGMSRAVDTVRANSQAMAPINLSQIKSWDAMTNALSAVEQKYDAVFRAGAHMSMMGQGLMDSGMKIAEGLMGVVDKYEDYDLMLRRGATALNTNTQWQNKLDEAIQLTAKTVGLFDPTEVAEAYYIWGAAAGVVVDTQEELDDITNVVRDTMIATAMAGGTLEGNLNGVYGVLAQFNLPAGQATDIVQKLALMTERTAAQFPDLINSLTYIGPLAESLGISFEDVASTLGILADAGQKGSRAGRGLSMVIEGMSAPSAKAKESLDGVVQASHGLNAEWQDIVFPKGEFVGMRQMVIELAKGLDDATDSQRGQFYATAFTNNATRALIPVIEDQIDANRRAAESGKEITSVLDDQKYALDGAGDFFETMRDQALGSITAIRTRLENSFFPILQDMAKAIMEDAGPVIDFIGEMADNIADFTEANPELVKTAIRFAGIAAAALVGSGAIFAIGGAILYLIGNLGVFFQGIGRILGPFGTLIGLFVAFGVAIWNNVSGIQDAFRNFISAAGELWDAIAGDGTEFAAVWQEIWDGVRDAAEWILARIADGLNWMADAMRTLAKNKGFTDFMREAIGIFIRFRAVISIIAGVGAAMWAAGRAISFISGALKILSGYTMVKGLVMGMVGAFTALAPAVGAVAAAFSAGGLSAGLGAIVALLGGPVVVAIGAVVAVVAGLFIAWQTNFLGIRDIVANVWNWLTNVAIPGVIKFFTDLVNTVVTAVQNIIEWFGLLPGRIGDFFAMIWEAITSWIGSVVEAIGNFVVTVVEAIIGFFNNLVENWDYYLGFILGFIIGWIANIIIHLVQFGIDFIAAAIDFLSKLPGRFADWLGRTWNDVSTWFVNLVNNVGTWMGQVIDNVTDWISKAPGRFMEWLGQVWNDVTTWFGGFIEEGGRQAGGFVDNIVTFISELPGKALDGIRDLLPKIRDFILSLPGRLIGALLTLGGAIIGGVWQGIVNAWNTFWDNVHDFFTGIVDGVKHALGIRSPSKVFAEIGGFMIQGMAQGISADKSAMRALSQYSNSLVGVAAGTTIGFSTGLEGIPETGLSVTSDATKVVRIEMDLTSSDGSYDDATLEQLKTALTGSDLVRALEHMAEAD